MIRAVDGLKYGSRLTAKPDSKADLTKLAVMSSEERELTVIKVPRTLFFRAGSINREDGVGLNHIAVPLYSSEKIFPAQRH